MTDRQRYTPTPEEIVEECAKIREGWTAERWRRQRETKEWEVPVIEVKTLSDLRTS
jgi:hypothetical protein